MSKFSRIIIIFLFTQILVQADDDAPTTEGDGTTVLVQSKQIWAQSYLWAEAPGFVVEKWLTPKPEMEGKFLLVEFWSTWCSACRRAQPLMNSLQDKFGDELVIIGISDEPVEKVSPYIQSNHIQYSMAIDTQARMKDSLGVWGIPHVIIVEPGGFVIWEGFPLLKGYELSEQTVQQILKIGRNQKS